MENFIVSARKYRPQTFDTVVGQNSITTTLKNAIRNNQLAQAFLFCGPRGIGKTTCARILAKTINCENLSPSMEACDHCPSCVSFNDSASFNIYELDGASNNSVDEIRNLVDRVRIPPQVGKYKVYIIDEVHMLSASAFNAFLKTLEEPPAYAKFILATTEKHKIIPTILSRCQIFDFKRITVDDIVGHLKYVAEKENIEAEENALHIIAQKADGAMRDALTIFDQLVSFAGNKLTYEAVLENLNVLDFEYYFKITGQILQGDISGTLLTLNDIIDQGFDGQHFLIGFGQHIRNLLVCKDPVTIRLMETAPAIRNRYLEQAAVCPADFLLQVLDIGNKCDLNYKISNNKRLHLELALMQMASLIQPGRITVPDMPVTIREAPPKPVAKKAEAPSAEIAPVPAPAHTPAPEEKKTDPPSEKETKPFRGTVSIRGKQTEDIKKEDLSPSQTEEPGETYTAASEFTHQMLEEAWDSYSEMVRTEHPDLFVAFRKHRPVLKDDLVIEFSVENKILEEKLDYHRNALLGYLKKRLDNSAITLRIVVIENPKGSRPYTDREKFEHMSARNPAMQDLREMLDLDLD
jgi:DNA polymerase III subunit gamma/tau